MKIVFFGSPDSALPSLKKIIEEGHSIELIITQPDKPSGRGKKMTPSAVKKFATEQNISVFQPEKIRKDQKALEKIKEIKPDLNVVTAYGQIIPSSIIFLPEHNSINVHFSLLPKYRGASPVQWAILNGEDKTGVTIFELNEKMDEGDIISQQEVDILPYEGASELEARLAEIGAELLVRTMARIDRIQPTKQNHSQATYAHLLKKEDGRISWKKDAVLIERQVRALTPWPSVYAHLFGKRIKIIEGRKETLKTKFFNSGEIIAIKKEGIAVSCGDKTVYTIETLQPENKKAMSAYAFSLGSKIKIGDKFN